MQSTNILQAIGKDLSSTEQEFLKFLATYENKRQEGKEASFSVMDCAFDLFTMLKNLASNFNALEAKNKELKAKFEALQRAIRLYCLDQTSKDELMEAMTQASIGVNIHYKNTTEDKGVYTWHNQNKGGASNETK
ncbi:hypothetical protein [Campylobacter sp. RM9328]|uniref:hypothetical protein n=1 Tax=Campylobacter sp. RM9328 TaxID=1705720 RepID=UPI001475A475|nr:hypothetical protein [Campylobacter sp. RM9328]